MEKQERLENANELIKVIGDGGRSFFKHKDRYAKIVLDRNGRVWWIDDYSGERTYTHNERSRWPKFSHGGTLRDLVIALRKFITSGDPVPPHHFGPWPQHLCGGDLWGYGEYMNTVRKHAIELEIVKTQ